jgi:hypothetical protein
LTRVFHRRVYLRITSFCADSDTTPASLGIILPYASLASLSSIARIQTGGLGLQPSSCCLVEYRDLFPSTTMTSMQPNPILGGKLNSSSSHSPVQQQPPQLNSPSFEASPRRSASNFSHVIQSGRNNQISRKQHKNQRRPRLADEDTMVESVSAPGYKPSLRLITCRPP